MTKGAGQQVWAVVFIYSLLIVACVLVWHNFRTNRGDRRGAAKLFLIFFAVMFGARLIGAHHTPVFGEVDSLFWAALCISALNAGAIWLVYMALEPWVRRRWPQTMISWSRFTTKGIRDPLVGRDILYGAAIGAALAIFSLLQVKLHGAASQPPMPDLTPLRGLRGILSFTLQILDNSIFDPLIVLFVLFLMRVLLRKQWAAAAATIVLLTVLGAGSMTAPYIDLPIIALGEAIEVVMLLRIGVPAVIAAGMVDRVLTSFPATLDLSAWYAPIGIVPLALGTLIAWYGFRTALAGKPLLRDDLL